MIDSTGVARISKALADPTRLEIYEIIAANPDMFCGEVNERLNLAPGTLSHHLKILTDAGLIECRREGQFVHSRAVPETVHEYTQALSRLVRRTRKGQNHK